MSQKDRVLADLREAGEQGVCSSHWYRGYIPNARNRIGELEQEGFVIASAPCADEHGPAFFRYWLTFDPERTPVQAELGLVR